MQLSRRKLLATAGGATAAIGIGGVATYAVVNDDDGDSPVQAAEDVPEAAEASKPLARAFYEHITEYVPTARVFVRGDGDISMTYDAQAEGIDDASAFFHNVAKEYALVIERGEHDPVTLTVIGESLKALVPEPTVRARLNGEINEKAFLETISVMERG